MCELLNFLCFVWRLVKCSLGVCEGSTDRRCSCCSLQVYSSWRVLECVVVCVFTVSEKNKRRPRSCRPWLQSLGCAVAPSVTGPLLEGIRLAKHHRSPVFNNNHLKLLQLARSYKEMESRKMQRGRREGYELRFSEPFECQLLFHMENSRGPLCSSIISLES